MELSKKFLFLLAFLGTAQAAEQRTTIFIHGTLFPIVSYYYHGVSAPRGVSLAGDQPITNTLGRLGRVLSEAAPDEFPLDRFYLLGWPGHLKASARQAAAQELYEWLKRNGCKSLTIIGHSHGATIALLLADLAQKDNNVEFIVDRLILIACPVQKATCHLVKSSAFKKVYSLYSEGDIAQICDVQGYSYCIPILSKRSFDHTDNLVQAKIVLDGKRPGHNDFLLKEQFLKQLPELLRRLYKESNKHVVAHVSADKTLAIG